MQPLLCTRRDSHSLAPQDRARCCPAKQCCSGLAHRPTSPCPPTKWQGDRGRCPRSLPEGDHQQQGVLGGKPEGPETSRAKKQEGEGEVGPRRSLHSSKCERLGGLQVPPRESTLGQRGRGPFSAKLLRVSVWPSWPVRSSPVFWSRKRLSHPCLLPV